MEIYHKAFFLLLDDLGQLVNRKPIRTAIDSELWSFLNAQDKAGNTFLHELAFEEPFAQSDETFYDVLMKENSIIDINHLDFNKKNNGGETPFLIAMKIRNRLFFRLAMNIKKNNRGDIDFGCVDKEGQSILHYLARAKNIPYTVILTSTYLKRRIFLNSDFAVPSELVPVQFFPLSKLFKRCEVNGLGFNRVYESKLLQLNNSLNSNKSFSGFDFDKQKPSEKIKLKVEDHLIIKKGDQEHKSEGFQKMKQLVTKKKQSIQKILVKIFMKLDHFDIKYRTQRLQIFTKVKMNFLIIQCDLRSVNKIKNYLFKFMCQLCKQKHRKYKNENPGRTPHFPKKGADKSMVYEEIIKLYAKQKHDIQQERFYEKFRVEEKEENLLFKQIISNDKENFIKFYNNDPKFMNAIYKILKLMICVYLNIFDAVKYICNFQKHMFVGTSTKESIRVEFVSLVNWIVYLFEDPSSFLRSLDSNLKKRVNKMISFPKMN